MNQLIAISISSVSPSGAAVAAATLGLSASIEYANTRCETFVSYGAGKEDLFNHLFTGQAGVYVCEEMPELKPSNGITGRSFQGLTDAVLKAVGV